MVESDDDDAFPSFDAPPAPAVDAAVVAPVAPDGSVRDVTWSVDAPGARLHFQILALRDQLYLYAGAGAGGPSHAEMSMALETPRFPGPPVVTALTRASGDGGEASAAAAADRASDQTAARFAKRTRRCVVAAVNLPPDAEDLRAFAEKQLADKIDELGM